jgi:hypothetical protein
MEKRMNCSHLCHVCRQSLTPTQVKFGALYCSASCSAKAKYRRSPARRATIKSNTARFRKAHPGYWTQHSAKRRAASPEAAMLARASARAQKRGIPFSISLADVVFPARCPVLGIELGAGSAGKPLDSSPSLDRIVPPLGYVPGNVRVISFRANRLKCDAAVEELRLVLADAERLVQSTSAYGA